MIAEGDDIFSLDWGEGRVESYENEGGSNGASNRYPVVGDLNDGRKQERESDGEAAACLDLCIECRRCAPWLR
jgi:hypothetical protein